MVRILLSVEPRAALEALGVPEPFIQRILRHTRVNFTTNYYDLVADTDVDSISSSLLTTILSRPEVIYAASWDMNNSWSVLKGSDPGVHKFMGWPV